MREHQYLGASTTLSYSYKRYKGFSNSVLGGNDFFMDIFSAELEPGILWLYGYGDVFEVELAQGETIDVESGAWVYKDPTVELDTCRLKLTSGLIASRTFMCNRFTGPGRVGIQSSSLQDQSTDDSNTPGGIIGFFLGMFFNK